uniref:Uncharacterized protein n=1 Tax=Vespula pensylvanica TaxID=30213 RepID=A0A834NK64_VESPE|nr:hypothetical protein H0235_013011 [Vespula pensylvanica]
MRRGPRFALADVGVCAAFARCDDDDDDEEEEEDEDDDDDDDDDDENEDEDKNVVEEIQEEKQRDEG